MQDLPLVQWASRHPRVAAWIVLATGMVVMVVYEGRDVGLQPLNWVALIIACILVAGLCIWIISWEDEMEEDEAESSGEAESSASAAVESSEATTGEGESGTPAPEPSA